MRTHNSAHRAHADSPPPRSQFPGGRDRWPCVGLCMVRGSNDSVFEPTLTMETEDGQSPVPGARITKSPNSEVSFFGFCSTVGPNALPQTRVAALKR